MNNMVIGLFAALLLATIAILVPSVAPVVLFLEKVGCLTIVFWALADLARRGRAA